MRYLNVLGNMEGKRLRSRAPTRRAGQIKESSSFKILRNRKRRAEPKAMEADHLLDKEPCSWRRPSGLREELQNQIHIIYSSFPP